MNCQSCLFSVGKALATNRYFAHTTHSPKKWTCSTGLETGCKPVLFTSFSAFTKTFNFFHLFDWLLLRANDPSSSLSYYISTCYQKGFALCLKGTNITKASSHPYNGFYIHSSIHQPTHPAINPPTHPPTHSGHFENENYCFDFS